MCVCVYINFYILENMERQVTVIRYTACLLSVSNGAYFSYKIRTFSLVGAQMSILKHTYTHHTLKERKREREKFVRQLPFVMLLMCRKCRLHLSLIGLFMQSFEIKKTKNKANQKNARKEWK